MLCLRSKSPSCFACAARVLLALLAQQESFLLCLRSKSPSCFACAARAPQGRVASQESPSCFACAARALLIFKIKRRIQILLAKRKARRSARGRSHLLLFLIFILLRRIILSSFLLCLRSKKHPPLGPTDPQGASQE